MLKFVVEITLINILRRCRRNSIMLISETQRKYFEKGTTRDINNRILQLQKFKNSIIKYELDIYKALEAADHLTAAFKASLGLDLILSKSPLMTFSAVFSALISDIVLIPSFLSMGKGGHHP